MAYDFVVIYKSNATHVFSVRIPDLKYTLDLSSPTSKQKLTLFSLKEYLEAEIRERLIQKELHDEDIETPKTIAEQKKAIKLDPNESFGIISIDYTQQNKSHYCATYLPPIAKTSLVIGILAQTVLEMGALRLTEDGIIEFDEKTGTALSVVFATLSCIFKLIKSLYGPEAQFLGIFGEILDDGIHSMKRVLGLRKAATPAQIEQAISRWQTRMINLLKAFILILAFSQIFSAANKSYLELNSLSDKIALDNDNIIPVWLLTTAAILAFIFGQFNDPLPIFKFIRHTYNGIDNYFHPHDKPSIQITELTDVELTELPADEMKHETHSTSGDDLRTSLLSDSPKLPSHSLLFSHQPLTGTHDHVQSKTLRHD